MFTFRYTLLATLLVAATITLNSPTVAFAEEEGPLIELLQSDAPKADKAITCKKLAVWGSAKAVPALAELLADPELASWARIALEAIPDPAAAKALREALGTAKGRTLIGVINSVGVLRDAQAVEQLVPLMQGSDADVASAAAAALGRIGNQPATEALRKALADAPDAVRSAVAEGCILCAEKMLADGKADEAARLYDQVRAADVPKQRVVEATRGAILARGAEGIPLLVEQLKSGDKVMVYIALTTARELTGPGVSEKLLAILNDVAPDQQALLILALADRGDDKAMPAMLEAAKSGPVVVRVAAIKVLQRIGDKSCVSDLLAIAGETEPQIVEAAKATLTSLAGEGIDADLVNRLDSAKGAERLILLELIGRRRVDAVPALLKAVDDKDAKVRAAALLALGEVAKLENVPVLIARVIKPVNSQDAPIALKALQAACVRMPDREACADILAKALTEAPASAKDAILETLTAMGGTRALQALATAAKSTDPQLQDTATRLLGSWMTVDAGPVLLELAKSPDSRFQVRALRGYIRLVRQFLMPAKQRVDMCREAIEAAQRDAERKLVLQVVERYPSLAMLRLAVNTAKKYPALKDDATAVAISVAQKLGAGTGAEALVKQLGQGPMKIEIVKATYGAGDKQKDVTAILRRHVRGIPLIVLPPRGYSFAFGGDPAPGVVKKLKVQYQINGKEGSVEFNENAPIVLPVPK